MGHVLRITPIFKEMIWGGNKLKSLFGYDIPSDSTGECWGISGHKNGDCVIANTEFAGMTISELWKNRRELFGAIEGDEFPLLVKLIDARCDLSVQVHPNNEYAKAYEASLGKDEMWYVLAADEASKIVIGHNANDRDELVTAIKDDAYDSLLHFEEVKTGDAFFIPAGTLHAICAGTLVYEIQQASDITYRVYDYHRKDKNGMERQLHVDKAIDVIAIPGQTKNLKSIPDETGCLKKSSFFTLYKIDVAGKKVIENKDQFMLMTVISGEGTIGGETAKLGDHFIVCADTNEVEIHGNLTIMLASL